MTRTGGADGAGPAPWGVGSARRHLLYAFLIKSCNDVANVLARDNAGSVSAFAAKMTAKARSLGCTNSRL